MNVSSHNNRSHHNSNQHYRRRSANNNSKKNNSSSTPAVLSGVIACLSGLDFDHKEELHAIITQLGGEYSGALDAGCGITHLVIDEPEGSVKYRFVQQIIADEGKGDDDMMKKWAKSSRLLRVDGLRLGTRCSDATMDTSMYSSWGDIGLSFVVPSPPPIPIPPMLPVPSKKKASAVVEFAADDVNKNAKDVKPALYSTTKDTSLDKPKRKYKQSTIFQGDIFVVIRPQQLPSSLSASLEYTQDEMESKITNAGGLILSKRILEAMKKDVVRKQQEHAIQQRRRKNNDNNDIATTDNSDEKRRYYVVSSGGHSNSHHSKYHPLLGDLSKILQQSSQLGTAGSTDLSSIIEPVSPIWVTSCIQEGYVYNPIQYPKLFQPQTYHLRLFPKDTKFLVSVTGFVDASRYGIIWMLRSLGAEYTDSLKAKNTHLICCRTVNDENNNRNVVGGGPKYNKAKEWGLHVVTVDWLYHCMRYGYEEGCEEQFLATRLEDQPMNNIKKEEKKSSDVSPPCKSDDNALSKSDDESSSPRRGKRDRKLPQASPIDNDSGKRFKSALQTLQSTPTVGTTTSSSSSRRRRGKRDRSPRTSNSQGSQRGENDGGGGSPSLLSQQSQESEYPHAETQFTIRADADIGKHWADSSGFDDDEAPLSQVNEAEDNGESQVVWLPFMRR
ncbi:BRCT domain-containing protein [Skeletonema marinoi]|uniref:BRCT domain-containing protein n=1 Tax=Skeletonema marinoi TaxID=267567 RepID=A0AAD8YNK9_9STRA|nr:BRCT domain-containing protein [Skeletonema marinoi]